MSICVLTWTHDGKWNVRVLVNANGRIMQVWIEDGRSALKDRRDD